MTNEEAIKRLWLLRNKYECLTYQEAEKISITNAEFVDAIQMAIDALKNQIPKKLKGFYCPVCSHYFEDGEDRNYCPCCGQHIDWGDTDKDD